MATTMDSAHQPRIRPSRARSSSLQQGISAVWRSITPTSSASFASASASSSPTASSSLSFRGLKNSRHVKNSQSVISISSLRSELTVRPSSNRSSGIMNNQQHGPSKISPDSFARRSHTLTRSSRSSSSQMTSSVSSSSIVETAGVETPPLSGCSTPDAASSRWSMDSDDMTRPALLDKIWSVKSLSLSQSSSAKMNVSMISPPMLAPSSQFQPQSPVVDLSLSPAQSSIRPASGTTTSGSVRRLASSPLISLQPRMRPTFHPRIGRVISNPAPSKYDPNDKYNMQDDVLHSELVGLGFAVPAVSRKTSSEEDAQVLAKLATPLQLLTLGADIHPQTWKQFHCSQGSQKAPPRPPRHDQGLDLQLAPSADIITSTTLTSGGTSIAQGSCSVLNAGIELDSLHQSNSFVRSPVHERFSSTSHRSMACSSGTSCMSSLDEDTDSIICTPVSANFLSYHSVCQDCQYPAIEEEDISTHAI